MRLWVWITSIEVFYPWLHHRGQLSRECIAILTFSIQLKLMLVSSAGLVDGFTWSTTSTKASLTGWRPLLLLENIGKVNFSSYKLYFHFLTQFLHFSAFFRPAARPPGAIFIRSPLSQRQNPHVPTQNASHTRARTLLRTLFLTADPVSVL